MILLEREMRFSTFFLKWRFIREPLRRIYIPFYTFFLFIIFSFFLSSSISTSLSFPSSDTSPPLPFFSLTLKQFYNNLNRYEERLSTTLPSSKGEMTISCWILTKETNKILLSLGRYSCSSSTSSTSTTPTIHSKEFSLFIDLNGKLGFEDYCKNGRKGFMYQNQSHTTIPITDNIWHHFIFIKKKLSGKFYLDGQLIGEIWSKRSCQYDNHALCIAADCCEPQNKLKYFHGMLADLMIWNISLTIHEIQYFSNHPPISLFPSSTWNPSYHQFTRQFYTSLHDKELHQPPLDYILKNYIFLSNAIILEFGVWLGSSINRIAAAYPTVTVYGFDSFEGLPEDWSYPWIKGSFNLNGNMPLVYPNVHLIKGWFNETLPSFVAKYLQGSSPNHTLALPSIQLLHIDCDLYSSTIYVLEELIPYLQPLTIIVFDELINFPDYEIHEMKAFYEIVQKYGIVYKIIGIECLSKCQSVAIQVLSVTTPPPPPPTPCRSSTGTSIPSREHEILETKIQ